MMEAPLIPPEIVAATGASRNTVKATHAGFQPPT